MSSPDGQPPVVEVPKDEVVNEAPTKTNVDKEVVVQQAEDPPATREDENAEPEARPVRVVSVAPADTEESPVPPQERKATISSVTPGQEEPIPEEKEEQVAGEPPAERGPKEAVQEPETGVAKEEQPPQAAEQEADTEPIVIVPESITAQRSPSPDTSSSQTSTKPEPSTSRRSTVANGLVLITDPTSRRTTVASRRRSTVVIDLKSLKKGGSSSNSSPNASSTNVEAPPEVIEIRLTKDARSRQPTIVIKPATAESTPDATSPRTSLLPSARKASVCPSCRNHLFGANTQETRQQDERPQRAVVFVMRHPHLARLVLKILLLLGLSHDKAMVKVVHWGLY
jgi:hypothetical protein